MNVLLINKFLYPRGGDALRTLETGNLLISKGHKVVFWGMEHPLNPEYPYRDYFISHIDFNNPGGIKRQMQIAFNMLYSLEAKKKIEKLIQIEKPDIVHLHNFAHQISPSILHVFKKYNIPVVMTMHDYKLVCASYAMLSKNKVCELCKNGRHYHCFLEGCVKDSKTKSLLNTIEMFLHHTILHIYDLIDVFISPSMFLKNKMEEMGFRKKIFHLKFFIDLKLFQPQYNWIENSIVYFGRLSREKGLFTLLDAVKDIPNVNLKIIGEGALKESLVSEIRNRALQNVQLVGFKSGEDLRNEIKKSMFIVVPSTWYENYPFTVVEGFALGKPVIGSRIGGITEMIQDHETGMTFEVANAEALREKISVLLSNPEKIVSMGKKARIFVEQELNVERHYENLLGIYKQAIQKRHRTD